MLNEENLKVIKNEKIDLWERADFLLIKLEEKEITREETLDYLNDLMSELVEQTT